MINNKNLDEVIFNMCKNESTNTMRWEKFFDYLEENGISKNDPRLREITWSIRKHDGFVDQEKLKKIIQPHMDILDKFFGRHFVVADFKSFTKDIEEIYWKCKGNTAGKNASYIPQLARVNPNYWGVSVCTIDGQRFSIGDTTIPFTIQSVCKPLNYAVALEHLSPIVVHQYVGQEPSGRIFNELVLDHNKQPHNPMINSGAILICSLLQTLIRSEMNLAEKFDFMQNWFSRMAGGERFGFNNSVFLSEREAADRNYALGFYMRENKVFPERTNLRECLDFYFQMCSQDVTCENMCVIAATLANGGICPMTGEKVFSTQTVRDVLSLMHSCGMYNYSGQFAFNVGLPAKSGVGGGVLLVVPNVAGFFTWSPPLDECGNSVRGIQFCEELVKLYNFHPYDNIQHTTTKKNPLQHSCTKSTCLLSK